MFIIIFALFYYMFYYILFVLYVCMCGYTHAMAHMWRSEDSFQELILFFHNMGPRSQTQVISFSNKCLYLLGVFTCWPSHWPTDAFLLFFVVVVAGFGFRDMVSPPQMHFFFIDCLYMRINQTQEHEEKIRVRTGLDWIGLDCRWLNALGLKGTGRKAKELDACQTGNSQLCDWEQPNCVTFQLAQALSSQMSLACPQHLLVLSPTHPLEEFDDSF